MLGVPLSSDQFLFTGFNDFGRIRVKSFMSMGNLCATIQCIWLECACVSLCVMRVCLCVCIMRVCVYHEDVCSCDASKI